MAEFMEIRSNNPKLKQSEDAKLLELLSSTIQRHRREINMLSPYRIQPSSKTNQTRKQRAPKTKIDDLRMTSNDLKMTSNGIKTTSNEPVEDKKKQIERKCKQWF